MKVDRNYGNSGTMPEAVVQIHDQTRPDGVKVNDGSTNQNPSDISFIDLIREDFETHERDFFSQGFWAMFWHRFGNLRMGVKARVLRLPLSLTYRVMSKLVEWMGGIFLPYTVLVGRRVKLEHFGGMILVADKIGNDVTIRQNTTFGITSVDTPHARPTIGDGVDIGTGAVVIGDITVGDNVVIGANAVVNKSVPADVTVGGIPARIVQTRMAAE